MDNGPGWLPDPEHEGQERYWDGSDWTDQVRPAASVGSLHLPEHVPELQRALAAATADIDEVEDRLSSLFDRTGNPAGAGAVHRKAATVPDEADDEGDEVENWVEDDEVDETDEIDDAEEGEDDADDVVLHEEFEEDHVVDEAEEGEDVDDADADDDAFAELDAALAAEAPDKPDRRFFRRRS